MAFAGLKVKFPTLVVAAAYKKKLIFGALHILSAVANGTVTPDKVKRGYTVCGQHLIGESVCDSLQSFEF